MVEMKRRKEERTYYRFACGILLTLVSTGLFFAVWYAFVKTHNQTGALTGYGNLGMSVLIYAFLYSFTAYRISGFKIGVTRKADTIAANVIALLITDVAEVFISMAITGQFRFFGHFVLRYAALFILQSLLIGFLTILMIDVFRRIYPPIRVVEIHGDYVNDVCLKMSGIRSKYSITDRLHYKDAGILDAMETCDAVLINDIPSKARNRILKYCFDHNVRVYFVPKISDIIIKASDDLNLIDTPLYLCRNNDISFFERIVKRACDVFFSLLAIVLLSPVFLITALAIKIDDGGPVFYKQERVTIGNKRFMIIKFRSMIVDAEKDGKSHPAGEHDDRITRVGRVIRAIRVDELPQLFNILKGDMSIVGPRPERVEHVEKYTADIPEFTFRSKVKGGLTGYAQVYGKYNTTALDKLKLDLFYIMNYSILVDVQIILETLKILFQKESTEGFSEERAREMHDADVTKAADERETVHK